MVLPLMRKEFLQHSLIYTLATLFNRGVTFLMIPIMTRYLHPADYGTLDLLLVTASFFVLICGLEIHQGVSRFMVDVVSTTEKKILLTTTLLSISLSYLVLFCICNIGFYHIVNIVNIIKNRVELNQILLFFYFQGFIYYVSVFLRFNLRPMLNLYLNTITAFAVTLFTVVFVIYCKMSLLGAIYGLFCGNLIGFVFAIYLIRNDVILLFKVEVLRNLLSYSLPLVLSSLSVYLMMYSDRIMLKHFLSTSDVGIFGVGYRFASIISILMIGIQSSITPLIYKSMNEDHFGKDLSELFHKFFVTGIVSLILLQYIAYPLLHIMLTREYYPAIITFRNMSVAIFFSQLYVFTPGLQIAKRAKKILYVNLFGGLLNLALCYMLVQHFALNGASMASMISYIVFFMLYMIASQREIHIPYNYKIIGGSICGLLISLIISNYFLI